jgi:hexosaminidase
MGTTTPVIPAPARLTPAAGEFRLGPGSTAACRDPALVSLARRFGQDVERRCGVPVRAVPLGAHERAPEIVIDLADDPDFAGLPAPLGIDPAGAPADERYLLTVDPAGVRLRARAPAGVARGLATLLQLIATQPRASVGGGMSLPALRILDAPRFAWRGLAVDVVRRFFPPPQIRRLIDLVALYKLDVLHLHLTDDQGWRVEPGRPGPARDPDGTFYTNDELRGLISYAADRFVTLLPEIDTPGWQESIRAGEIPGTSSSTGWTRPASGSAQTPRTRPRSPPG